MCHYKTQTVVSFFFLCKEGAAVEMEASSLEDREAEIATCLLKLSDVGKVSPTAAVEVLRDTQLLLEEIDQEEEELCKKKLEEVAGFLSKFCDDQSAGVRLWTASCLCEIFRIFAPRAPYSREALVRLFESISAQIRRVGNVDVVMTAHDETLVERVAHIIESMRQYQSCLVIVELFREGAEGGEAGVVDFVQSLLVASTRDEVPRDGIVDVLCLVVTECEDPLPEGLLELFLTNLLPSSRRETPASHAIVQIVVKRLHEMLTRPIGAFLCACLDVVSGEDDDAARVTSSDAYALVYELHLVEPRMLLYTLPTISERLRADDVASRNAASTLLARLFASSDESFDYVEAYPAVFAEWLRRFVDKEPEIRTKMVQLGLKCCLELEDKPIPQVIALCAARLNDPNWEVRRASVHACADAILALKRATAVWNCVVTGLAERVTDRRPDIRKESLTGLCTLYRHHVSSKSEDDLATIEEDGSAARLLAELVPSLALRSYGAACNAGDVKDRARLLLDEKLFASNSVANPERHASEVIAALGDIFLGDNEAASAGFELLLRDQAETQNRIVAYLEKHAVYREKAKVRKTYAAAAADSSDDEQAAEVGDAFSRLEAAQARLAEFVPTPDGKTALLRQLSDIRDNHVFRFLGIAADCSQPRQARIVAREDLVARLDSKKQQKKKQPLAIYAATLARRASDAVVDKDLLGAAFDLAAERLVSRGDDEDDDTIACCAALVRVVSRQHPKLVVACSDALGRYTIAAADFRHTESFIAAARALVALTTVAEEDSVGNVPTNLAKVVEPALLRVATTGFDDDDEFYEECSKEAVRAISALREDDDEDCRLNLATTIFEALDSETWTYGSPHLVGRLKALNRLVLHFATEFDRIPGGNGLIDAISDDLIDSRPPKSNSKKSSDFGIAKDSSSSPFPPAFLVLRAAIKTVAYHSLRGQGGSTEKKAEVLDMLFGIIDSDGQTPSGAKASEDEKCELDLSAASSALKLVIPNNALSVFRRLSLARVAVHPDHTVRAHFCRKLAAHVERCSDQSSMFAKWGSMLCLVALPKKNDSKTRAVKAFRVGVAKARARHARETRGEDDDEDEEACEAARDKASRKFLPEYALPYTIHLLAHLDEFDDDAKRRSLAFLLDALVKSLGTNADNVPFLLRCCAEIAAGSDNSSRDISKTEACRDVALLAADELKTTYVKTLTNFTPYPGNVFLPAKLFAAASPGDSSALQRYEAVLAPKPLDEKQHHRRVPTKRKPVVLAAKKKKKLLVHSGSADEDEDDDDDNSDDESYLAKENQAPNSETKKRMRRGETTRLETSAQ